MKPPAFEYASPATVAEAVSLLASRNGNAKVISGGQSLMPMLAFRLAAPELLVDLKHLKNLGTIQIGRDGVRLGAKVRWCDIENDVRLVGSHPLLAEAIRHVAHYQIRNRGTVGGSVAHADPSAEMPGIAMTCEALMTIVGSAGTRIEKAADFFIGPLQTSLEPDEILTEVHLPAWPTKGAGHFWSLRAGRVTLRWQALPCTMIWTAPNASSMHMSAQSVWRIGRSG
jgi:carbon-monoxide dehydrogenase medium subunit